MTLEEIIGRLDDLDNSLTICVEQTSGWDRKSNAELCQAADVPGRCRFPYFLEVAVAKDVLRMVVRS